MYLTPSPAPNDLTFKVEKGGGRGKVGGGRWKS